MMFVYNKNWYNLKWRSALFSHTHKTQMATCVSTQFYFFFYILVTNIYTKLMFTREWKRDGHLPLQQYVEYLSVWSGSATSHLACLFFFFFLWYSQWSTTIKSVHTIDIMGPIDLIFVFFLVSPKHWYRYHIGTFIDHHHRILYIELWI